MNEIAAIAAPPADTLADDLAGRVASRICHDLVSPLGAIGNGLELMEMTGGGPEEAALVGTSAAAASAKLRLFRIAFGAAPADRMTNLSELRGALADPARGGRCRIECAAEGAAPRADARLIALLAMCCEAALPQGGTIRIAGPGAWRVTAEGPPRQDPLPWGHLMRAEGPLESRHVEFDAARHAAHAAGRVIEVDAALGAIRLRAPVRPAAAKARVETF